MAADDAWKEVFEIVEKQITTPFSSSIYFNTFPNTLYTYELVGRANQQVYGSYKDRKYAKRQARHKYKQIVKTMERTFMSRQE